jgi:glutamate-1-semialdehyde aminotransferase
MKTIKSQKLWSEALEVIAGGNMLLSKRPDLHLPGKWPVYFNKAKGCFVWDLDNNKFTDFSLMGVGTNILGYANSQIDNAVISVIKKSISCTLNCKEEVKLAKKLIKLHPWASQVKFARTGGEANAIAVRIARSVTRTEKIAFCGYHGWHDWYVSSNLNNSSNLSKHLLDGIAPSGVPISLKNTSFPFEYNKISQLENLLKKNIKIIFMEVKRNIDPDKNFLKNVRKLANKYNAVLIFDECTSGFRETFGGLHLKYKVNPDLAVFGKALGNGYAITAVIGKSNLMKQVEKSFISSTFWSERVGPAAAIKTLQVMEKNKSWSKICKKGKNIKRKIIKIAEKNNVPITINGLNSHLIITFKKNHNLIKTFFTQEMLKKGFLATNVIFVSLSHTNKIIKNYLSNLNNVFKIIGNNLNNKFFFTKRISKEATTGFKRIN